MLSALGFSPAPCSRPDTWREVSVLEDKQPEAQPAWQRVLLWALIGLILGLLLRPREL